jgi:hypothetical protein
MVEDSRRNFFEKVAGSAVSAIATAGLATSQLLPANAAELAGGIKLPPMGLGAWYVFVVYHVTATLQVCHKRITYLALFHV